MTRPRRSFGHDDANTRSCGQERNVGARRALEPSREAVVDGFAEQQEADHVRREHRHGDQLEQRVRPLRRCPRQAPPSRSPRAAARAPRSSSAGAILLRRRHQHCAELVGDPEQIDADALLLALRGRGERLGLVGREIEMRSDHALQREVAGQQDGVRLRAARRAPSSSPRRLRRSSAGRDRACARLRATHDDLREAERRQQHGDDQRRESDEDLGAQAGARPPASLVPPGAARRRARARRREREFEGQLRIVVDDGNALRDVFGLVAGSAHATR